MIFNCIPLFEYLLEEQDLEESEDKTYNTWWLECQLNFKHQFMVTGEWKEVYNFVYDSLTEKW